MYAVLQYIREHIEDKLTLDTISEIFGYSKWHLCRRFHEEMQIPITEYIRSIRIQLSAQALAEGDKVIHVASRFGYDTVSGFNKAFLKEYGCYPQNYKKEYLQYQQQYEERRKRMYPISDRAVMLREAAIANQYSDLIFAQRDYWFYKGILTCPDDAGRMECIGAGLCSVLENIRPCIFPGELIVGYNFSEGGKEYTWHGDDALRQWQPSSMLTPEEMEWFIANRGKATSRIGVPPQEHAVPVWGLYANWETPEDKALLDDFSACGHIISDNHSVIGYNMVLTLGVEGLLAKIAKYREVNGSLPLYDACETVCRAFGVFMTRYGENAAELAAEENDTARKAELEQIAADCRWIGVHPPKTFRQAVQAVWFSHILNTFEDNINANSVGRLDQILYPFYKHDIETGVLTKEEAFELICCLWIKLYRNYDVQQSAVGGTNPDGTSAVNDLSWLMLDATEQLDFIRCLSVRYSAATDKAFLQRALEVVGHVQKGVPFFFNDDVMIPALEGAGISHEDACDYTQIGCVETVIPGCHNPHAVTSRCNLLKCLEYVFGGGHSLMKPELMPGIDTGDLEKLKTFPAFYDAVKTQIAHMIERTAVMLSRSRPYGKYTPKPVKSMLSEGCLESGRDFNDGGCRYDTYQMMLMGVPNLADSLMVIKEYVYQNKTLTLTEMKNVLDENFPDEAQRLEWVNRVSKYGNGMDKVDELAADIISFACDCIEAMEKKYNISIHAQPFTYLWMIDFGANTAATPDGRRKGEIMAYSMSPMQGRDFNGFTALLHSLCRLPTRRTPGTTSAIVEIDPALFTARNLPLLTDSMLTAAEMGLSNVQFNIIDAETLIDAQKHPECHQNLAVRVSGFSQRFSLIAKPLQDHIIARTKHRTL